MACNCKNEHCVIRQLELHRQVIESDLSQPSRWQGQIRRELRKNKPAPKENAALRETFNWLVERAAQERMPTFDSKLLKEIHARIVEGGGTYRTKGVRIGQFRTFPSAGQVSTDVERHLINIVQKKEIDLWDIANLHLDLVSVHPFTDGNGRAVRLMCTALMLNLGYKSTLFTAVEQHYQFDPAQYGRILGKYRAGRATKASVVKDFLDALVANTKYIVWFRLRNKLHAEASPSSPAALNDAATRKPTERPWPELEKGMNVRVKSQLYYQLERILAEENESVASRLFV